MSVIDRVLQGQTTVHSGLTVRDAAAMVLVTAITADGEVSPAEGMRLQAVLSSMQIYRDVPPEHLQHLLDQAVEATKRSDAVAQLPTYAAAVPDELRASLFALAVELVFADGRIAETEKQFVDALQAALEIPDELAMKVVEVLLLKGRI